MSLLSAVCVRAQLPYELFPPFSSPPLFFPTPTPPEWRTPLFKQFPTLLTELQLLSAMQLIQKAHDSGGGQLTKL